MQKIQHHSLSQQALAYSCFATMKILLIHNAPIPVYKYGGTERVIWDLGKTLVKMGHEVTFLVPTGSTCDFAKVLHINSEKNWNEQVPKDTDIVHFQFDPEIELDFPFLMTEHGHSDKPKKLPLNTVFLSKKHAQCHGSTEFVYNGLDWSNYGKVDFSLNRQHCHFLGKAARRLKNVKGAIKIARQAKVDLDVLGGTRFGLKGGLRYNFSSRVHFHGMLGGEEKFQILNASRGLIFPVMWHEPFGLAIIESLYFGCPVFATPYGAIPELVPDDGCGYLSLHSERLALAITEGNYDPRHCQEQALKFNASQMANDYLVVYEKILSNEHLHQQAPQVIDVRNKLPFN